MEACMYTIFPNTFVCITVLQSKKKVKPYLLLLYREKAAAYRRLFACDVSQPARHLCLLHSYTASCPLILQSWKLSQACNVLSSHYFLWNISKHFGLLFDTSTYFVKRINLFIKKIQLWSLFVCFLSSVHTTELVEISHRYCFN